MAGTATIETGPGNDEIDLQGVQILGKLKIESGAGDDLIRLRNIDPANDPDGPNSPYITTPAHVQGNVELNLGEGADTVNFGAADPNGASTVGFSIGGTLLVSQDSADTLNYIDLSVAVQVSGDSNHNGLFNSADFCGGDLPSRAVRRRNPWQLDLGNR